MASPPASVLAKLLGEVLVAPNHTAVTTALLSAHCVPLVGLYFGYCGGRPGAQLAASLAAFYARFEPQQGAVVGTEQHLEIIFVAAKQDQPLAGGNTGHGLAGLALCHHKAGRRMLNILETGSRDTNWWWQMLQVF